jgi:hypothetical protein
MPLNNNNTTTKEVGNELSGQDRFTEKTLEASYYEDLENSDDTSVDA